MMYHMVYCMMYCMMYRMVYYLSSVYTSTRGAKPYTLTLNPKTLTDVGAAAAAAAAAAAQAQRPSLCLQPPCMLWAGGRGHVWMHTYA